MPETTRREDRENLFHTVYEAQMKEIGCVEILESKTNTSDFVTLMCKYIDENNDDVKNFYTPHLNNWTWDRLPALDKSILTIAYSEVKYMDTPFPVVCNEAVEIAKTYSSEQSYKFVNAILKHLEGVKND
jgi:N utilization substance protein B